jgi:hypothetical protein
MYTWHLSSSFHYFERTYKPRWQLPSDIEPSQTTDRWHSEVCIITNFQNHFSSSRISITLLTWLCSFEILPNDLNLSFCFPYAVRSKELTLSSLVPKQWCSALSSIQSFKWFHLDAGLIAVVISTFCIRQTLVPTTTILQCTSSQHVLKNLICSFCLTICLRMVC